MCLCESIILNSGEKCTAPDIRRRGGGSNDGQTSWICPKATLPTVTTSQLGQSQFYFLLKFALSFLFSDRWKSWFALMNPEDRVIKLFDYFSIEKVGWKPNFDLRSSAEHE